MAKTPEGKVKNQIMDFIKNNNKQNGKKIYYVTPMSFGYASAGVPDILLCVNGRFIGVEVKADRKKRGPTSLQLLNLAEIHISGGVALVVDKNNIDEFFSYLSFLLEGYTEITIPASCVPDFDKLKEVME